MRTSFYTAVLCLFSFGSAHAESLVFGGVEGSGHRSSYGQLGVLTPLPGSTLGNGWHARAVAEGLTYKYQGGPGTIKGDAAGGQVTAGYQQSGAPGWWGFFTGPAYRYTDLSPNDPSSKAEGSTWGWMVQGEAEHKFTPDFKVNLAGNYTFSDSAAFWSRVRLLYRMDGEIYAGPEGVYQGDDDYAAWQLGAAVVGMALDKQTTLGLKAGVRKVENFSLSPYAGVEMGRSF